MNFMKFIFFVKFIFINENYNFHGKKHTSKSGQKSSTFVVANGNELKTFGLYVISLDSNILP